MPELRNYNKLINHAFVVAFPNVKLKYERILRLCDKYTIVIQLTDEDGVCATREISTTVEKGRVNRN